MIALAAFVWSGLIIHSVSLVFANIVIAAVMPNGLAYAAIFTLAQYISMLIQAPQRGIVAASISHLSQAWKDKDLEKINRIYHRSSINQLIFATGMFILIWINFTDAVSTFHLRKNYIEAQHVFLFLGLKQIIDMGTGVNSQIIGTSTFWRFDFITGIILLAVTLVLNYFLTKQMGVVGSAIADFASLTVYNAIRYIFLLKKFGMQPFTMRSLYIVLLAFGDFVICYYLFQHKHGLIWMVSRSAVFITIYLSGALLLNLSPDILPVWRTVMKRLGIRKEG
jgi:O-antigen/teichoic acid export membrane protein